MDAARALNGWYWRQMATWAGILGRRELAREYWERLWSLRPADPSVMETLAHLHAAKGERAEAIALYERALAIDAKRADGWFNLGFLRQENGAHEAALEAFDHAIALNEKHDRAWYGKALSLVKLGRLEEAVPAFRRNTELQPMSPYGWYQLVHVLHRLGRRDEAEKAMRRLAAFEPKVAQQLQRETGIDIGVQVPF